MTGPAHVALVGCGFTGTSAFFQLVDRHPVKEITIFEATGDFGPGYPYRVAECPDYLLNNTTDTLCLVPSNRRAFVAWAKDHPDLAPQVDDKGHLPRAVFGAFLKDVVAATRTAAAIKGIKVNLIAEEVTGLSETAGGQVILNSASGQVAADAAILTTGRCPAVDPYPHPPAGSAARYIANHVLSAGLDDVPLDATVHILGASLSAYDVINRLFSPRTGCRFERVDGTLVFRPGPNGRHAVICSRTGRVKSAQSRFPVKPDRRHFAPDALRARAGRTGLTLADVASAIQADAAGNGADVDWDAVRDPYAGCASAGDVNARAGDLIAQVIAGATDPAGRNFLVDFFGDAQLDIWALFGDRLLAAGEERAYRDRFESAALTYAAPCPASTAEKLLALHRAGRLRFVRGTGDVTLDPDGTGYRIPHAFGVEKASVLVNTTGSLDRDVRSAGQPALIRDLVARGLLRPDERDGIALKGAAVDMATFRARGARNVYLANMLLWGPGFFTSSAFLMAGIVERLLGHLFDPTG